MYLRARLMAAELRAVGIDTNCAPLADIAGDDTHPFLHNRCYGRALEPVVKAARATTQGLLAGGVLPVLKHIPGHGRATVDSHLDLPRVTAPAHDLRATDFAAFQALADLPLGMTAHIVFAAFDPDLPATQSPAMMAVIRDEIGFDGLVMTDDISMQALAGDVAQRSEAALAAGCDIVLHCNGNLEEMERVAAVSGRLTAAAQARADRALAARVVPDTADLDALSAELDALFAENPHV
jgi:beta-N-acetylhexosaminidase